MSIYAADDGDIRNQVEIAIRDQVEIAVYLFEVEYWDVQNAVQEQILQAKRAHDECYQGVEHDPDLCREFCMVRVDVQFDGPPEV